MSRPFASAATASRVAFGLAYGRITTPYSILAVPGLAATAAVLALEVDTSAGRVAAILHAAVFDALSAALARIDEQLAKGVSIEEHPVKRAISTQPVVKPIKITAPNSVFALGAAFSK